MKNRGFTVEYGLYGIALLIAFLIRVINLGQLPLSESEAALAIQALSLSKGSVITSWTQSAYVMLTSVLFTLFDSTNFTARILPALSGSILVFFPFLLRNRLGKSASLVLAFALAVDPGMVALSRTADGLIMGLSFGLFSLACLLEKKPVCSGICLGIAVLSGATVWQFVMTMLILWGWVAINRKTTALVEKEGKEPRPVYQFWNSDGTTWDWKKFGLYFIGTFILLGTMFFIKPFGIASGFHGIWEYITGWGSVSGASVLRIFLALVSYEILPVVFGVWKAISGWIQRDETDRMLVRWLLIALLLLVIYPSHQVADLTWTMIPLWILAARQIVRIPFSLGVSSLPSWAQCLLMVILVAYAAQNLLSVSGTIQITTEVIGKLVASGAAIILIMVIFSGVAWGWGLEPALKGFTWGLEISLSILLLSCAMNAGGLGSNPGAELWRESPIIKDADLFKDTVESYSLYTVGNRIEGDINVAGVDSPAMRWLLKDFTNCKFVNSIDDSEAPEIVVTPFQEDLALSAEYSGQDFVWEQSPNWDLLLPQEWYKWMMVREITYNYQRIMIWVRSDITPADSAEEPSS